jgi:hypothetical protein
MLGLFVVAVIAVGLTPMRQITDQNEQVDAARQELEALESENAALSDLAADLRTDAGVERLARQQFGLVRPGDRLYAVETEGLAPPAPVVVDPEVPPAEPNVFTDVLDFITGKDVVDSP